LLGAGYVFGHEWWHISSIAKNGIPWLMGAGFLLWVAIFSYGKIKQRWQNNPALLVTCKTNR